MPGSFCQFSSFKHTPSLSFISLLARVFFLAAKRQLARFWVLKSKEKKSSVQAFYMTLSLILLSRDILMGFTSFQSGPFKLKTLNFESTKKISDQ